MKKSLKASKISIFSLATAFLISACGGGGSDDSSSTGSQQQPEPPFTLEGYTDGVSINTLSIMDSLLQLSFTTHNSISTLSNIITNKEVSCSNGGIYQYKLIDNDKNKVLSDGDSLTADYQECYVESLQGYVDGSIVYNVEAINSDVDYKVIMDASELIVDGSLNLQGKLGIDYKESATQSTVIITAVDSISISVDNEALVTLNDITVTKVDNYQTAKFSASATGEVFDESLNESYRFTQTTPFSGFFGEYPNEGEMDIFTSETDRLVIKANFVENSSLFDISYNNSESMTYWLDAIEGAMMGVKAAQPSYLLEYRSDNFTDIQVFEYNQVTNFGLNDSVDLMYSRPVESAQSDYSDRVYFESHDYPYSQIPAKVTINGAIVTLTPEQPLQVDRQYSISSLLVTSINQQTIYSSAPTVKTRNDIIPILSSQSILYSYDDTPWLSASESVNNSGVEFSYQWRELSEEGVTFVNPTAETTDFTVPKSANEDLIIEVTISNESGYSVNKTMTIRYMDPNKTFLSYVSPNGDYIGGGQNQVYTKEDGHFNFEYSAGNINLNYDGNDWWHLDLAAPEGDSLMVGIYENATRYPFQSPTAPGLNFSGTGRGCNQSSGQFEIIELAISQDGVIEKLAVDFEQNCELTMPTLKGKVRFNSQLKINP